MLETACTFLFILNVHYYYSSLAGSPGWELSFINGPNSGHDFSSESLKHVQILKISHQYLKPLTDYLFLEQDGERAEKRA